MKNFTILAVACIAVFSSCSPIDYEVSRETVIEVPALEVYEIVSNHRHRNHWSPWEQREDSIVQIYEGTESGVGAIYRWSGGDSVGSGYIEILEAEPPRHINSKLTFTAPWESESFISWNFTEDEAGLTTARWTTTGSFPGYLFWMNDELMEEMMGPDFESGLQQLKLYAEGNSTASRLPEEILLTNIASLNYYFVEHDVPMNEISVELFSQSYNTIYEHLSEDKATITEPPFAIFHEWDEEQQRARFEVAVAADNNKPAGGTVKTGETYEGEVALRIMRGPYEDLAQVHEEMIQYMEDNNLQMIGSPWESYVIGPGDDPNPENWVTEIYYPVSRKPA